MSNFNRGIANKHLDYISKSIIELTQYVNESLYSEIPERFSQDQKASLLALDLSDTLVNSLNEAGNFELTLRVLKYMILILGTEQFAMDEGNLNQFKNIVENLISNVNIGNGDLK